MLSIAQRYGFRWRTLWDHPANQDLKARRGDPNVLNPGDIVEIPDHVSREEAGATETRHRFRRKGVAAVLRLKLLDRAGKPRPALPYVLQVDGKNSQGSTDGNGLLEVSIPPDAAEAVLTYELDGGVTIQRRLRLGGTDPSTEGDGLRQRLANLGYLPPDAVESDRGQLERAVRAFQQSQELEPTGSVDDSTRKKLRQVHGS